MATPSIGQADQIACIEGERGDPEWGRDILSFLRIGNLPTNNKLTHKIKIQSAWYTLVNRILYRRGYTLPLLKCLSKDESAYVLKEMHEGVCGSHSGHRMLAHKVIRAGYYWLGIDKDSRKVIKHYDKCQRFSQTISSPPEALSFISSPWPFIQWGVDLVGPISKGK